MLLLRPGKQHVIGGWQDAMYFAIELSYMYVYTYILICAQASWLRSLGVVVKLLSTASLQPQTLRARVKEEQRRRQEQRDAEKKQARRVALRQRWADLQRLARNTHYGYVLHATFRAEKGVRPITLWTPPPSQAAILAVAVASVLALRTIGFSLLL